MTPPPKKTSLEILDLGRRSYGQALEIQKRRHREIQVSSGEPEVLILVEHDPPAITLGRRGRREDILAAGDELESLGVEVHEISRGGEVTWHGPGQLVAYPILRLDRQRRTVREHIHNLEETAIRTFGRFGVEAQRNPDQPGVWVGGEKIASIGVAVKRWVSLHGIALNICCDLEGFAQIVPCGKSTTQITTLQRILGRPIEIDDVKPLFTEIFRDLYGF